MLYMVHFKVPIYCDLCSYTVSSEKNGFTSERKEICLISPEGISTEQTGIVTTFKADNTSANGDVLLLENETAKKKQVKNCK